MRSRHGYKNCPHWSPPPPSLLACELSTDEANNSGFFSTLRVCMVSYESNKTTGSSLMGVQWQISFSSEQLAVLTLDMQYIIVTTQCTWAEVFTIVLQLKDVLKKLAKPNVPKEATVREVDLMSALQCRVQYNTFGLLLLWAIEPWTILVCYKHWKVGKRLGWGCYNMILLLYCRCLLV